MHHLCMGAWCMCIESMPSHVRLRSYLPVSIHAWPCICWRVHFWQKDSVLRDAKGEEICMHVLPKLISICLWRGDQCWG